VARDDLGEVLDTGVYVFKLSGDGWETEEWSSIDCGADANIQSRIIVGGHDVAMSLTNIVEDIGSTELAVYSADGNTRVKDFSYLNTSPIAFCYWAFEDSVGQILPAGDYIYRMASASYSEDITFTIDPINRGSLSVTITDGDGSVVTGINSAGDAPLVKGPLQQVEIDFGRPMSAAEIEYLLEGGLSYYNALAQTSPVLPTIKPDSTGIIFNEFDLIRPWKDIWGDGVVTGYGMFDPYAARFRFGYDHVGYTPTDHLCNTIGEIDNDDWVLNDGPFFFTPIGSMMPPCNNPILPDQYAQIRYSIDNEGPVVINIINSEGFRVRQLINGYFSAGYHTVYWDRLDDSGTEVVEGLYHLIWEASPWDGGRVVTSGDIYVSHTPSAVPHGTAQLLQPALSGNHPNPFNPTTVISFDLPSSAFAQITVLSLDGKQVATLLAAQLAAGSHNVTWNARNNLGRQMPSGTYFYRLEAGGVVDSRRMLLLK